MWGREDENFRNLQKTRKNDYMDFADEIELTSDLEKALELEIILVAILVKGMQDLSEKIGKALENSNKPKTFVLCMKGIDEEALEPLSKTLRRQLDKYNVKNAKICVWVGPGHTREFLAGKSGVMVIDGEDPAKSQEIANMFTSPILKLYVGNDLLGAEIGAALKNVLGIAAGMLDGLDMATLKGGLMARGLYEVSRLIVAMGGERLTPYGLSCLGDFEATMFSQNSHNRMYGEWFVGRKVDEPHSAEGVSTARAVIKLAERHDVRMRICNLVYQILYEGKDAKEGLTELFLNPSAGGEFPST